MVTLTPKQRQVVMYVGQGKSFAWIAQKLKISGAAVHYRARYAVKKLPRTDGTLWEQLHHYAKEVDRG